MTAARTILLYVERRDHRLMRRINRWRAPRWIRLWMLCATRLGDGWLYYGLGAVLLLEGGPARYVAMAAAAMSAMVGIAVFQLLKRASGRKRPCAIEPHCWANIPPPDQFSFPSGHSILAFAIAVPIGLFYPALTVPLLILAVSIAASRVILGMHFLSDVIAGCLIGAALGYSSFALLEARNLTF
jgi:undecaprenyl-diphosphatase